jgi:hypothetical protein
MFCMDDMNNTAVVNTSDKIVERRIESMKVAKAMIAQIAHNHISSMLADGWVLTVDAVGNKSLSPVRN